MADINNSVTDIDFFRDRPPMLEPDDLFREVSTDFGWMLGAGVETALSPAWALRLDASYMQFGRSTYAVNRGRNNRCGPGGSRRPCLYEVEHTLGLLRLGFIYHFGRWLARPQNWYRTPSFIASGSSAAMTRSLSPVRSEKFVTALELKRL